jgi:hypothetical protein
MKDTVEFVFNLPAWLLSTFERRETDTMPGQSVAGVRRAGWLFCVWLGIVLFQLQSFGQGTVVYSGFAGRPLGGSGVDFGGDGTDEFSFSGTYQSTGGNPDFRTDTYFVSPGSHSALAFDGGSMRLVNPGTLIGSSLSPVWGGASNVFSVFTIFNVSPTPLPDPSNPGGTPVWPQYGGPLADAGGMAYLAARWQLADGLHYGWIRLSSQGMSHPDNPYRIYLGPLVADWAYNAVPGEPILAGAVPEPSKWALLAAGAILFLWYGLRKQCSTIRLSGRRE